MRWRFGRTLWEQALIANTIASYGKQSTIIGGNIDYHSVRHCWPLLNANETQGYGENYTGLQFSIRHRRQTTRPFFQSLQEFHWNRDWGLYFDV